MQDTIMEETTVKRHKLSAIVDIAAIRAQFSEEERNALRDAMGKADIVAVGAFSRPRCVDGKAGSALCPLALAGTLKRHYDQEWSNLRSQRIDCFWKGFDDHFAGIEFLRVIDEA